MNYLNFGFHTGIGGDPGGLVAFGEALLRGGRPFVGKAVADAGRLFDLQQMYVRLRLEGIDCEEPVLIWRHAGAGWDTPNYELPPAQSLLEHWGWHDAAWPPELDPGLIWREIVNEVDKNRADWIGWFCYYGGLKAIEEGKRFCGPGWSAGEPELEHWRTPGMLKFLELCHQNPDSVMVATHAYSLDNCDLRTGYPHLIGREAMLVDLCQERGFTNVRFVITEFGWGRDAAPEWQAAGEQLLWAGEVYSKMPGYSGAAIWFLGNGEWGNLYQTIHTYVEPLKTLALAVEFPEPDPGDTWEEAAVKASIEEQIARGVYLNSEAGLQRAILASGRTPVHREFLFKSGDRSHVIQAGEDAAGVKPRQVYYWDGWAHPIIEEEPVPPPLPIVLLWPVDSEVITQPFGANPEYYRQFGLPGHEGIDFRAPYYSPVRACADGRVYMVYTKADLERKWHNYGIHVRVEHAGADGRTYKTVYAHLQAPLVSVGHYVVSGQEIGKANSTGNSSGHHLHLTLKCDGATARGETNYPFDIIDPTPFLEPFSGWDPGKALVGVHGRADGNMEAPDFDCVAHAKLESVFIMGNCQPYNVEQIRAHLGDVLIVARLFVSFHGRTVAPWEFFEWVKDDTDRLYAAGVRYFQIHNEPNLGEEGMWSSWGADGFGSWVNEMIPALRSRYPEVKLGWPGLSPGPAIPYRRYEAHDFFDRNRAVVSKLDWVGVHCYWTGPAEMNHPDHGRGYEWYRLQVPNKPILITEFSNPSPLVHPTDKGYQYLEYYRMLPGYVVGAYSFVLSSSSGFDHEVWRLESGQMTEIPGIIRNR